MADEETGFKQVGSPILPSGTVDDASFKRIVKDGKVDSVTVKDSEEAKQVLSEKEKSKVSEDFRITPTETVDISSLPDDKQKEYKALETEVLDLLEGKEEPARQGEQSPVDASAQLCPNCSWDQSQREVVEVTEEDKEMWLKHLLSGTRFIKEYRLFGNRVMVVLRGRTVAEQDLIMQQLGDDQKKNGEPFTPQMYLYWWSRYALAASLQSIHYEGKSPKVFPEIINEDGKQAYKDVEHSHFGTLAYVSKDKLGYWSDMLHNAVLACQQNFDQLCSRLQFQARSENFFENIDGAVF